MTTERYPFLSITLIVAILFGAAVNLFVQYIFPEMVSGSVVIFIVASVTALWSVSRDERFALVTSILALSVTLYLGFALRNWIGVSPSIALVSLALVYFSLRFIIRREWDLPSRSWIFFRRIVLLAKAENNTEYYVYFLYFPFPLFGAWIRERAASALVSMRSYESMRALADAVHRHSDANIVEIARGTLEKAEAQDEINAICDVWAETRHAFLEQLIVRRAWIASKPVETRILSALKVGEFDLARKAEARMIPYLLRACADRDPQLAGAARQALESLEKQTAREAVCQSVIKNGDSFAKEAARSGNYAPEDEKQRALYFFFSDQWERYDTLDFDRRTLRKIYSHGAEKIRQRMREKIKDAGKLDLLPIIVGDSQALDSDISPQESAILADTLIANRDWDSLWKRVFDFPFTWSVRGILALKHSEWKPQEGEERAAFNELIELIEEDMSASPEELKELFPPMLLQASARVPGRVNEVAFAFTRPTLAIATGQGKIALWNYQTATRERVIRGFEHSIARLAFTPDDALLCADRSTRNVPGSLFTLMDAWNDKEPRLLGQHPGGVSALTPLGKTRALSASRDANIVLWDLATGKEAIRKKLNFWARDIKVSPNEQSALCLNRGLDLIDLPDMNLQARAAIKSVVHCADFGASNDAIYAGLYSSKALICRHRPEHKRLIAEKKALTEYAMGERVEGIIAMRRNPIVITASSKGDVRFFSSLDHSLIGSAQEPAGKLSSICVSRDEFFLALGNSDSSFTLWDLRSLDMRLTLDAPFARADVSGMPHIAAMINHGNLSDRAKRILRVAQCILRHRFRFEIEIGEAVSIPMGEFDIDIERGE